MNGNNKWIIWFVDVLLMYVEVENEVNGLIFVVYIFINCVCVRVDMLVILEGLFKEEFR